MPQVLSFQHGVMKFASDFKVATAEDLNTEVEVVEVPSGDLNQPPVEEVKTVVLPEDFDKMTVEDLKKFAADNEIDLGANTLKDDIKAVIVAAATPAPAAE